MIQIRKPYDVRDRVQVDTGTESLVQQSHKKDCDVNYILQKYQKTGLLSHVNMHHGDYSDVTGAVDYQTALNIVINAQGTFESLPSSIRAKFHNDPAEFFAYATDAANEEGMRELGLLDPLPEAPASPAPPAEPTPPA